MPGCQGDADHSAGTHRQQCTAKAGGAVPNEDERTTLSPRRPSASSHPALGPHPGTAGIPARVAQHGGERIRHAPHPDARIAPVKVRVTEVRENEGLAARRSRQPLDKPTLVGGDVGDDVLQRSLANHARLQGQTLANAADQRSPLRALRPHCGNQVVLFHPWALPKTSPV